MGFFRRGVAPDHPDFGKPIRCENERHTQERLAQLEEISGLRGSDLNIRLNNIFQVPANAEMLDQARKMISKPKGKWLYLWGGPGNAKTMALMAMVNEINMVGKVPAMYIKFSCLIDWMRESFREKKVLDNDPHVNLGYIQRFSKILSIRFLAIDEMDKARGTPFADEFRFDFLDERYQSALRKETSIVFASNSDPATLPPAIYDRINDGRFSIVENRAPSSRPVMK